MSSLQMFALEVIPFTICSHRIVQVICAYVVMHPFQLPDYYTDLHKKSFIVRSLYEYIK